MKHSSHNSNSCRVLEQGKDGPKVLLSAEKSNLLHYQDGFGDDRVFIFIPNYPPRLIRPPLQPSARSCRGLEPLEPRLEPTVSASFRAIWSQNQGHNSTPDISPDQIVGIRRNVNDYGMSRRIKGEGLRNPYGTTGTDPFWSEH